MIATGVMICEHASRAQATIDEIATLSDRLPMFQQDKQPAEDNHLAFAPSEHPHATHRLAPESGSRA